MRRWVCLVLVLLLMLSGCENRPRREEETADKLIVTYLTMSYSRLDGLERIQNAINAIVRDEAGVEIELLTEDSQASFIDYPLWLTQGKRIDLMMLNYQDIQSYVKNGQLLALDDLIGQYGVGIQAVVDSGYDLTSGTTAGGSVYGLSVASDGGGVGGGLWITSRCLEEAGFRYDADHIYTMEELDTLFARLKELYPDQYPLGQMTAGNTFSTYQFFYGMDNPFGSGDASGSLDMKTGQVINFYETDRYREFLSWMREWYMSGYIYPDVAYTGFSAVELINSGEILSIPLTSQPGMYSADDVGEEIVCLSLSEVVQTYGGSRGMFWVIPATCQDPVKAMKFLDLMYSDQRIVNLFVWGEEGRDYRFLDRDEGVIAYPEDVTIETAEYYNPLGLYGDMRLAYSLNSNELKAQQKDYAAKTLPIGREYAGFLFDEAPVTTEAWKVHQVLGRYLPVLESGCVELDENYEAFLSALREAGIDTIIAEKQRQLDEWLAKQ